MTVAEKLAAIAANEQRVYDAGYAEGAKSGGGSSEGLDEIETKIDESGVLDGTEQSLDEKVDTLIDRAEDEKIWYEVSRNWQNQFNGLFRGSAIKRLPRLNYISAYNMQAFVYQAVNLETIDFYIDTANATRFYQTFMHCYNLKSIVGINTSNATNVYEMFKYCYALEMIQEPLDFSKATDKDFTGVFISCSKLITVRFVPNCIAKEIRVDSPVLSDESIQSIVDGLADLTGGTTQTLTLNALVIAKLTEAQIATITSKNWVVA